MGAASRALTSYYMRDTILSLIIHAVKYQSQGTSAIARANTHARDSLRACNAGCRCLLTRNLFAAALDEARASRDEFTNNHVFLEAHQVVGLGFNGGFRQNARRFLERCGGTGAIGIQSSLGDTQQAGLSSGGVTGPCRVTRAAFRLGTPVVDIVWQPLRTR